MAEPTSVSAFAEIGTTGARIYGGQVYEERHPKLTGSRAALVYREMADNEAIVGAILYSVESLLRQVTWSVRPAKENDKAAQEWATFLDECRGDMSSSWPDTISEILSFCTYGWSYLETVYKVRRGPAETDGKFRSKFTDGRIGWRKLAPRAQESLDHWQLDADGGIRGMWQSPETGGGTVFLPIEKCLLFRTKAPRNNPEGRSLLRNAYVAWFRKKRLEEIEGITIERDGTGFPVFRVPPEVLGPNATDDQRTLKTTLQSVLNNWKANERAGLLFPAAERTGADGQVQKTGYEVTLLGSPGQKQIVPDTVIRRYRTDIALCLLHQWILLGTEPNGSRALADTHTDVSAVALGALLQAIAGVFNSFAIPRLMTLNGVPQELWPTLEHGNLEDVDLSKIATAVQALVNAGALVPDARLERHLRAVGGLPEPEIDAYAQDDDEDEGTEGAAPVAAPGAPTAETVADTALNGAQVSSLLEIVRAVTAGEIPRSAAVAIIMRAFQVDTAEAERMLGDAGFKREEAPSAAPPPAA